MKAVGPRPRAGQRGEEMRAWRVIDHLPEKRTELRIVGQPPVLLDVADEQQVMRQVRARPGRQQIASEPARAATPSPLRR